MRHCSKPNCNRVAVSTLTYDYRNSTAVLGPLSTTAEPHSYDMCEMHATQMTVPKGWDVVRLQINYDQIQQSDDDLMALVEAVRDAAEQSTTDVPASSDGFSAFDFSTSSTRDSLAPEAGGHPERVTGHFRVVEGDAGSSPQQDSEQSHPEQGPF